MRTTTEYLDAAKQKLGISSDYALAQWLGVTKQAASHWKTGKRGIDDYTAAKLATLLGLNPLETIAVANMEREKNPERREFWRQIATRSTTPIATLCVMPTAEYHPVYIDMPDCALCTLTIIAIGMINRTAST